MKPPPRGAQEPRELARVEHQGPEAPAPRPGAPLSPAGRAVLARVDAALPPRPAVPAPDPGVILAAVPRPDGTELRVSLQRFEGRPFLRVAPWHRGDGGWWPVKGKGVTVKVRELRVVVEGLVRAAETLRAEAQDPEDPEAPRRTG